jgi:hypothetical protein
MVDMPPRLSVAEAGSPDSETDGSADAGRSDVDYDGPRRSVSSRAWPGKAQVTMPSDRTPTPIRDAAVKTGMTDGMEQRYRLLDRVLQEPGM